MAEVSGCIIRQSKRAAVGTYPTGVVSSSLRSGVRSSKPAEELTARNGT